MWRIRRVLAYETGIIESEYQIRSNQEQYFLEPTRAGMAKRRFYKNLRRKLSYPTHKQTHQITKTLQSLDQELYKALYMLEIGCKEEIKRKSLKYQPKEEQDKKRLILGKTNKQTKKIG